MPASGVTVKVAGKAFDGWKSARVVRGIDAVCGSFDVAVSDRWANQLERWQIAEEDTCSVALNDTTVITGWVDRRSLSYGPDEHTLSVSGRDKVGAMVDCSAVLTSWEFWQASILTLAERLAAPFGVKVAMQAGLAAPTLGDKLTVDPGDSAFEALERGCRLAGVMPVSDGHGGLVLTRAGSSRCRTALVEGENILAAHAQYDATGRYRTYRVTGQHPGTDDFAGDETATVRGSATDLGVRRADRVLLVRSENTVMGDLAAKRAQWEAKTRAARGDSVNITVQGWQDGSGALWPVNALVDVRSPRIGVEGRLLVTQATHVLEERSGTTTELVLKRPDAYLPEPIVQKAAIPEWAGGV